MQIHDYLRAKKRWLAPLVVVPILAGAVTGVVLAGQPTVSEADVVALVPTSQSTSDAQIGLYIARVEQALRADSLREQIAQESGLAVDEVTGISVKRVNQSDQFTVTLRSTGGNDRTLQAATAAANAGAVQVTAQAGSGVEDTLNAAKLAFNQAQDALFSYQDEIGVLDPAATYEGFTRALASSRAAGNTALTASLEQQRQEVAPYVRRYSELRSTLDAARAQMNQAQAAFSSLQSKLAAAESGQQIVQSSVDEQSLLRPVAEGVGLAVVVAFFVIVGLAVLPDLLRSQRTPAREEVPEAQVSTGPADTSPTEPVVSKEGDVEESQVTTPNGQGDPGIIARQP